MSEPAYDTARRAAEALAHLMGRMVAEPVDHAEVASAIDALVDAKIDARIAALLERVT